MSERPRRRGPKGRDYAVGRGKPPANQWTPGQSGNPKGRPKGAKNIKTIVNKAARRKVTVGQGNRRRRILVTEVALHHLQQDVIRGDRRAILDYLELLARYEDREETGITTNDVSAEDREILTNLIDRRVRALKSREG